MSPSLLVQHNMQYTNWIMTLNINGIETRTRLCMFEDFLHRHDVDIVVIQEVTNGDRLVVKGYQSIVNEGTLGRGIAILHK